MPLCQPDVLARTRSPTLNRSGGRTTSAGVGASSAEQSVAQPFVGVSTFQLDAESTHSAFWQQDTHPRNRNAEGVCKCASTNQKTRDITRRKTTADTQTSKRSEKEKRSSLVVIDVGGGGVAIEAEPASRTVQPSSLVHMVCEAFYRKRSKAVRKSRKSERHMCAHRVQTGLNEHE